ncbi:hypothetical protein Mth01_50210 [Sphaerimonospora thailandensis]|uniref:Uncharacterized protein n=1 Tax=Sphaerimonospora thailandensis TaxID=795644 RepID=A0A8J3W238_9ACTN|nr:hypothetical protein Mth01_50210 [Sphaerimonospora thailandensis]
MIVSTLPQTILQVCYNAPFVSRVTETPVGCGFLNPVRTNVVLLFTWSALLCTTTATVSKKPELPPHQLGRLDGVGLLARLPVVLRYVPHAPHT